MEAPEAMDDFIDDDDDDEEVNPDLCKAGLMWKRPTAANAMRQDFQLRYFELLPGSLNYYIEKGGKVRGSLEFPNDDDESELKIDILPMNMGVEGKGVTKGLVPTMDKGVSSLAGMIGMCHVRRRDVEIKIARSSWLRNSRQGSYLSLVSSRCVARLAAASATASQHNLI